MKISPEQKTLVLQIAKNLRTFVELYGDEESEELLNAFDLLFSETPKSISDAVYFTVRFRDKARANIFHPLFRTHAFKKVTKEFAEVEIKVVGKLADAGSDYICWVLTSASQCTLEEIDGDLSTDFLETHSILADADFLSIRLESA